MAWTKISKKSDSKPLAASKDAHRDVLPRTGLGLGATVVDSASKFLASYGKVLGPMALLLIVGMTTWWILHSRSNTGELELRNRIDAAAAVSKLDDLTGKMETVIAETKEAGNLEAYAQYRYAIRAFDLLTRPYKAEELSKVVGILDEYVNAFQGNEQYRAWNLRIKELSDRLKADQAFVEKRASLLPWDHNTKFERPAPKIVEAPANPIVVFRTSVGDVRWELYEDDAPNGVSSIVSNCREGYYDRTGFSALAFSNAFSATGPFRGATVIGAGREGRPIGVELKKPDDAKEEDDVDTKTVKSPYTIDYEGSPTRRFEPGMIALGRDEGDPSRARSEFIVVIEPSDAVNLNYLPLGQLVGGEAALDVARRLGGARIYYTWVEQQRKGEYLPMVQYDGWPVLTRKRDKKPEPVRYGKLAQVIDDKQNPLIVISLESGDILIELFEDVAPNTVKNFIALIEERFYDIDCEFYRVEGSGADLAEIYRSAGARIIQGGNDQSRSRDKYDYNIRNEAVDNERYDAFFGIGRGGIANARGTISMARTDDLDGAGTEFFINLKDHPNWDAKNSPYCAFGRVIEGVDLAAGVAVGDFITGAKVIRKRSTDYTPEVKYKDKGVWQAKNKETPKTQEEIDKAHEARKKEKKPAAGADPSMPSFTPTFG